jgi:hypothetical protein
VPNTAQALATAAEGYQDAERPIEAARFARIAELLKPTEAQQAAKELTAIAKARLNRQQLKSGEVLYDGKEKGGSKAALF